MEKRKGFKSEEPHLESKVEEYAQEGQRKQEEQGVLEEEGLFSQFERLFEKISKSNSEEPKVVEEAQDGERGQGRQKEQEEQEGPQ